jgi:uncharacterized membrane protein YphA (DoxX/SURF4 family)
MHRTRPRTAEGSSRWRAALRGAALLALCSAYLQGGIDKLLDFPGAIAEMAHFGLHPAALFAAAVISLELAGSALVLFTRGGWRVLGALALATFTFAANFLANAFWQAAPEQRQMMANGFFEHLGLVGGFLLVAWTGWAEATQARAPDARDV